MNLSEQQLRTELADCYHAFEHYGWTDSIFTHLSARVPGHPDHYLINPYGLLFHEVTADNLLKINFDGQVIAGDYPYNEAGHSIHTAVLKARADVQVVLHSHTRAGMAVSALQCGLLPISQQANELGKIVCYHNYAVIKPQSDECDHIGLDLKDNWLMILRNHGLLSVGRSVAEAFYFLYTLENACKVQVDVLASGQDPVFPEPEVIEALNRLGVPPRDRVSTDAELVWQALRRLLKSKKSSA